VLQIASNWLTIITILERLRLRPRPPVVEFPADPADPLTWLPFAKSDIRHCIYIYTQLVRLHYAIKCKSNVNCF